jgi:hypothetical protein
VCSGLPEAMEPEHGPQPQLQYNAYLSTHFARIPYCVCTATKHCKQVLQGSTAQEYCTGILHRSRRLVPRASQGMARYHRAGSSQLDKHTQVLSRELPSSLSTRYADRIALFRISCPVPPVPPVPPPPQGGCDTPVHTRTSRYLLK